MHILLTVLCLALFALSYRQWRQLVTLQRLLRHTRRNLTVTLDALDVVRSERDGAEVAIIELQALNRRTASLRAIPSCDPSRNEPPAWLDTERNRHVQPK